MLKRPTQLYYTTLGIAFAILGMVSGCEDSNNLGFKVEDPRLNTVFVDTFKIATSTVLIDSMTTSGTGRILVGEYENAITGKVSSASYFQVGLPFGTSFKPAESSTFDSLALILDYDKYWYGDTLSSHQIGVYQLNEDLSPRPLPSHIYGDIPLPVFTFLGSGFYNNSKSSSYPGPIGALTYFPRPFSGDSVSIRLADEIGQDLFTLAQQGSGKVNFVNFTEHFKGLELRSPDATAGAIVGFATDSALVRMYYTTFDNGGFPHPASFDYPVVNSQIQYNKVEADRSSTAWAGASVLVDLYPEQTNNETFLQGGSGAFTKIQLPDLSFLGDLGDNFVILSARLVVKPVTTSSSDLTLPSALSLYTVNKNNIVTATLKIPNTNTDIQSILIRDRAYNENTRYSFSITDYVESWVRNPASVRGELLIGLPPGSMSSSITRARIGNTQKSNIKLELLLSRFVNRKSIP